MADAGATGARGTTGTRNGSPRCTFCGRALEDWIVPRILWNETCYDVYYCPPCKIGKTVPTPSPELLSSLYSEGTYRSGHGRRFRSPVEWLVLFGRYLRRRRIERHRTAGRILDIGCGRGLFLDVMKRAGWSVAGVESSRETAEAVSGTYGVEVVTGEPRDWGFPLASFDVITMSHVLEHMVDPVGWIDACHGLLKPGGLLVASVPNIGSLQATVGKGGWFHLDVPRHLHHFSREGLQAVLDRSRFTVVSTRNFDAEYSPFGWLQTLLNVLGIRHNLLYDMLKRSELRGREEGMPPIAGRVAALVLLPVLFPLALLLSLVESFLPHGGGTVEVFATRNPPERT